MLWAAARILHSIWRRAPAVEKARGRRERIAEAAASMARGSGEGRTQDRADRGRLRGRPGRLLVGALAQGARYRGLCHSCIERSGVSRASARQDRPARHRVAQTLLSWLAAWRA